MARAPNSDPVVRVPSPTPTAAEALGNLALSQRRFRHLCASGSQAEVKNLLEEWPGEVTSLNDFQVTSSPRLSSPLCEAARNGHRSLLEYLVSCGFSLFASDLHSVPEAATRGAAETGNTEILELLLELGWDLNSRRRTSSPSAVSWALNNESIVRWFLDHGADPNGACLHGCTATTAAANASPLSVVKLLVDYGGTIANTDAVPRAVLGHNNGQPDRLEVAEYLLDNGAPIDIYLNQNSAEEVTSMISMIGLETALQHASRGGRKDMVELLLRRGADKNRTGRYFESCIINRGTALEIAEMNGFNDIASLLKADD